MSALHIPCPNCHKELKVKDPKLLGRKAKCPACGHRFVLEWTAEETTPVESTDTAQYVAPAKRRAAGSEPDVDIPRKSKSQVSEEPSVPAINVAPQGGIGRLNELKRRNRQRRNKTLMIGAVFVGLLVGGYFLVRPYLPAASPQPADIAATTKTNPPANSGRPAREVIPPPAGWVDQMSPTSGEPIALRMVPSGVRLIVNLRPAQLWSNDPQMAELRASLTQDVTSWLQTQLRSVCRYEPAQIEEVLLAWILGARGTEPELTAVVHLVDPVPMSDLLDEFGTEVLDELAQNKVYVKGDHAALIIDPKTFAIAPRAYGSELPEWIETPNYNTSDGILELLPHTDRERLVTVVFEPADMKRHLGSLVNESALPVFSGAADWFAAHTETVAWSLHTDDEFHSEILVRGSRTSSTMTVEAEVRKQMETLPQEMVALIRKMRPQRSGFRQLIGRLPAMLEVSRQATISSFEGKAVRLLTVMPPKAAPNLALASVLAWDESTRTDFTADAPPVVAATGPKLPDTVKERLQLPVFAEFNRMPLQEAMAYIGSEIEVAIEMDGNALKDASITKNEPQTFNLGEVSAAQALTHIVDTYKESGKHLVIVLDEGRKTILVTTQKFADQQGLTVHDLGA